MPYIEPYSGPRRMKKRKRTKLSTPWVQGHRDTLVYQTVQILGGLEEAAKMLDTSTMNLRNWISKKEVPERMILIIEEKTGGKIRREMMRPELFAGFIRIT